MKLDVYGAKVKYLLTGSTEDGFAYIVTIAIQFLNNTIIIEAYQDILTVNSLSECALSLRQVNIFFKWIMSQAMYHLH